MKNLIITFSLLFISVLLNAGPSTTAVNVKGMTCGSCENSVTEKLKASPNFQSVRASHEKGNVTVTLKNGVSLSRSEIELEVGKLLAGTDFHVSSEPTAGGRAKGQSK